MANFRWQNEDPPEHEFESWKTPEDILGHLAGRPESEPIKRRLIERLRTGSVLAFAGSSVQGKQGAAFYTPKQIYRDAWCAADDHALDRFWEDGDLIVRRQPFQNAYTERFLDVRFEPESLEGRGPKPTSSPPANETISPDEDPETADKPPLSDALLTKWAALFNDAYPNGSEALARQSVAGMFPDKSVTRARLRRVLPERQPGRPKKHNGL